ncbi:7 transmembrane receptor [Trichostrongylus colubriformis]|uniref:7 transmembrane receptor n=1 Tax=Trichostrongylus colubriformis TaxID=6319 RepID=A0AAN8ITD1_TRICO
MEVSIFMGIVCLMVVCGNIFVLYALITQPSLHTTTNFLVLSLTISDLLLGTLIIPFAIIQEHSKKWLFGNFGCRLWLTADVWLSTASIYNLLAISFDRYMAVRQPIRYPSISSKRVTRFLVSLVWVASGLLALCLFVLETLNSPKKEECSPTRLPDLYITFSASASFIVPTAIMIALNVSIFCTVLSTTRSKYVSVESGDTMRIHRGKRKSLITKITKRHSGDTGERGAKTSGEMSPMMERRPAIKDTRPLPPIIPQQRLVIDSPTLKNLLSHVMVVSFISTSKKKHLNFISHLGSDRTRARSSLRTELRVARTTFVVVGVFIVCWFPFTTIYVLQAYSLCLVPECITNTMYVIAFWLGYANSAVNPILYAVFSRDFRAAFRKLTARKRKKSTVTN